MKKWLLLGCALLGIVSLLMWNFQRRGNSDRKTERESLAESAAQQSSTSFRRVNAGVTARPQADATTGTNSPYHRILSGDQSLLHVPSDTISAYLQSNGFSAESLLVAFQIASNREYLITAATKYPNDPRVQFAVLMNNAFPEQRAQWIARFKESAPNNSLPNYVAAREAFRSQQPQAALQEIVAADRKTHFSDYVRESMQSLEELYMADGRSPAEAKLAGMANVLLPHLKELRDLSKDMTTLQQRYLDAGDSTSANLMAASAFRLGQHLGAADGSVSLLSQLIGLAIESQALAKFPPDAAPDFVGVRVDERLAQIKEQKTSVRESSRFLDQWIGTANEREVINYFDRVKLYGESAALTWLRTRNAAQ
jgi:hypothetical protein